MATTFGFTSSDVIPQPGFSATRNANNGWDGEHSFKVLRSFWSGLLNRASFNKGVSITTLDSSIPSFWFLYIDRIQVTNEECEWVDVKTFLTGSSSLTYENSQANEPTYSLNGILQDALLSEHTKYKALADDQKLVLGKLLSGEASVGPDYTTAGALDSETGAWKFILNSAGAIITLAGDSVEFAKRINDGQTTYLRPLFTWTENAEGTDELPTAQINDLGKIDIPAGSPPTPAGGRSWMLTSATQEERAGTFRISREWTMSEKGGYDTFLYE